MSLNILNRKKEAKRIAESNQKSAKQLLNLSATRNLTNSYFLSHIESNKKLLNNLQKYKQPIYQYFKPFYHI